MTHEEVMQNVFKLRAKIHDYPKHFDNLEVGRCFCYADLIDGHYIRPSEMTLYIKVGKSRVQELRDNNIKFTYKDTSRWVHEVSISVDLDGDMLARAKEDYQAYRRK